MKILVIGSEGFIGRYMVRDLKAAGHEVAGFDLVPEDAGRSGYVFHQGSILSREELMKAARGAEMVVNLAAKHHDFGVSREEFFLINETGTQVMLDVMAELGIKRLVFYSSVAVYGDVTEFSHEGMGEHPVNDYGRSKLAGEALIKQWAVKDASREVLIMRPVVVFGPHNFANMFRLIDSIYHRRFLLVGKGDNIKSVCYVENLVAATLFMMQKLRPGIEVVNYSDEPHKTSREIANIIRSELGKKPLKAHLPLGLITALASPIDLVAKAAKVNFPITASRIKKFASPTTHGSQKVRALGFKQKFSIEGGLRAMVRWYLEEGINERKRSASGPRA
ncbi:MAG TPA: NAD(P)-dependent oxidoreductase [Candidatus Omnitrophota bacterium]|nr:NAD(P)-dependent oxidoreductase [Candidatus Omnitrophota bacterium]HSA31623.1 NAD(P)-dependent oxidoreductase [Candidatus Omnitrophota bacterium]